ncbi:M23 family metallopeptidase [Micromonospora sp. NPDC049679]|uniref:M23 family metallopeptidase n=1 Tax=Micromonospora sp. NPDC049679 TaxID=3155920 RepID=UPI0033D35E72
MQENTSPDNPAGHRATATRFVRRLIGVSATGRRWRIAVVIAALVAFGAGGAAVITGNQQPQRRARHTPTPTPTAEERQPRADVAARADRAERESAPPKPAWVSPMPGAQTTSCFGMRWGALHAGVDLALAEDTPIQAAGAGTVLNAGWLYTGYGNSVLIDHGDGVLTHYAHMNKTAVTKGQTVGAGDLIGYEGATGDSTGPHLHFEVHLGALWKQVDPQPWMKARGVELKC